MNTCQPYFRGVGQHLSKKIDNLTGNEFRQYMEINITESLFLTPVTKADVMAEI